MVKDECCGCIKVAKASIHQIASIANCDDSLAVQALCDYLNELVKKFHQFKCDFTVVDNNICYDANKPADTYIRSMLFDLQAKFGQISMEVS